jgi:hypothetical protein
MIPVARTASPLLSVVALLAVALVSGCSSQPAAMVSEKQLTAIRAGHAANTIGAPKQKVLDNYKNANKVKLGMSQIEGVSVEEWKVEAFHDTKKKRDLFVTFLYFCDDRFVDSSDTRLDFRNNTDLAKRWMTPVK